MSVAFAGNSTTGSSREAGPLRVMVVDDSVVIRGLISRWIGAEHDMEVAASLRTGLEAVNQLERINPDVAVLDIEMPELDGISALPQLLAKKRDLVIIMASTLTRRNAEISFKALSLGAADYIPKPESTREASAADIFHHDLIQKIRHLGARLRRKPAVASPPLAPASPRSGCTCTGCRAARRARTGRCMRRRRAGAVHASVLDPGAEGAADRLIDRRSAGADGARHRARPGDRPRPGADHPAHAADLHHHSRRASGAREPQAGSRGGRRRAGEAGPHLSRARRQAHARRAQRRGRRRSRSTTVPPSISASPRSIRCSPPPSTSGTATSSP